MGALRLFKIYARGYCKLLINCHSSAGIGGGNGGWEKNFRLDGCSLKKCLKPDGSPRGLPSDRLPPMAVRYVIRIPLFLSPGPASSQSRKIVWVGEIRLCSVNYAAMDSKSSFALLLAGLSHSTASRCSRASSLCPR